MENSPPFDPGQIAKMLILSLLELTLVCLKYHHTKPSIQTYILLKLYDIIFAKDMKFYFTGYFTNCLQQLLQLY